MEDEREEVGMIWRGEVEERERRGRGEVEEGERRGGGEGEERERRGGGEGEERWRMREKRWVSYTSSIFRISDESGDTRRGMDLWGGHAGVHVTENVV